MSAPLKFLLIPIGSAGDVLPLVWLGRLLRARGHEVLVIAQEMARDMPERAGLATLPWGDAAEQEALIRNPDLWHPRRAIHLIAHFAARWAGESIPIIRGQVAEGRTVMIAGALAFGARVLAERWSVPLLTAHVQPAIFMSVEDTPVMVAHGEWLRRVPRWVRRAFFGVANWMVDRKMGPGIEEVRRSVGLPPGRIKGLMRQYWHSPDGVLCLFPEWFAPQAGDWPRQAVLSRFPLDDGGADRPPDPAVEAFLAAGDAPIIITPGSANAHAERFIRQALAACGRLGRRALVITRYPEQVAARGPEVACFQYVPFGRVFPRVAAIVHHGGIGTVAQCLAAGVPQLIMPLSHDQPDNAARVKRMGAGDYLYPSAFKASRIAGVLETLLRSEAVKGACAAVRERSRTQMSEEGVAELIEARGGEALGKRRADSRERSG
jgi:rhamnosyltransferase subunit B